MSEGTSFSGCVDSYCPLYKQTGWRWRDERDDEAWWRGFRVEPRR